MLRSVRLCQGRFHRMSPFFTEVSMADSPPRAGRPGAPWRWLIVLSLAAAALTVMAASFSSGRSEVQAVARAPERNLDDGLAAGDAGKTTEVTMVEMLGLAKDALAETIARVDDYTVRLIKQERDRSGALQPASEIFMKVITRHAGGKRGGPLKVYLRFDAPEPVRGREVIWVEDENNGKMLVREAGMIGAMMTVSLPPDGYLAMQGQRYPIAEIGLTRLLEKLIERGGEDRDDPRVHVFRTEGYPFDDRSLTHLRIERSEPSGEENDFAIAELVLDRPQNLVVSYRSFGWPEPDSDAPRLIESYEYHDLQTNVGLTDRDFDTGNPDYTFAP